MKCENRTCEHQKRETGMGWSPPQEFEKAHAIREAVSWHLAITIITQRHVLLESCVSMHCDHFAILQKASHQPYPSPTMVYTYCNLVQYDFQNNDSGQTGSD